jgi:GNAT superfamily N-acetyltransferase
VHVRALTAGERDLLVRLRLRSLADSPDAFGDSLAQAEARADAYWDEMLRSVTEPGRHTAFLAEDGGHGVGLVFGLLDADDPRAGRVAGMWVAPEARGRGAGRLLLEAVIGWARDRAFTRLTLWVTEGNRPAEALYRTRGFLETGGRDVLGSNPSRTVVQMALDLAAERAGPGPRC